MGSISHWNPFCSVYRPASRLATVPSDGHAGGVNKGSMGSNVRKPQKRVMGMGLRSLDFFRTTWLISQFHEFPYDLDKQTCQVSRNLLYMIFKVLYSPDNLIWRLYWSTNNTSTLPGHQSFLLYDCLIYLPFEIRHQRPLFFLSSSQWITYCICWWSLIDSRCRSVGSTVLRGRNTCSPFLTLPRREHNSHVQPDSPHSAPQGRRKIVFWSSLLSENTESLLLHAVNLPEHILPLSRKSGEVKLWSLL